MSVKTSQSRRANQYNSYKGVLAGHAGALRGVFVTTACIATAVVFVLTLLVFHKSAVPAVHADTLTLQRVQSKLEQSRDAASKGRPHVMSLDQDELNSLIESRLASYRRLSKTESRVRQLRLQLTNDRIGIHLALDVYGQEMTLDIAGTLRTHDGHLEFDPVGGKIGAVPIPQSVLREAVRQSLSTQASQRNMELPVGISDLRVESGELVATYR